MDTTPFDFLRVILAFAVLGGILWTAWVVRQHYATADNSTPIRLSRMMHRLGIKTRGIESHEYAVHLPTAARLCKGCKSKADCDAWLSGRAGVTPPPAFCQNAQFLNLLRNDRARSAAS